MYHGFKGGLRFRMLLPELSQGLKVKVYYRYPLPDLSYNSSVAHSARTAVVPVQMKNHAKFTYTYENPTVGGNGPAFVPLLVSVNQVDCHLDFEITCENPFNWNVIKQFNSLVPEEDIAADLGSLIFVFPTPYENKQVSLFVSVADESRLAMMYYNSDIIISTPAPSSDFAAIVPPAVRPYFFASISLYMYLNYTFLILSCPFKDRFCSTDYISCKNFDHFNVLYIIFAFILTILTISKYIYQFFSFIYKIVCCLFCFIFCFSVVL
jgi:hypothetical protein